MCFGIGGIVFGKSCDVEIVQEARVVFNTGEKDNERVGRKRGYIYSSSCDFLVQLVR